MLATQPIANHLPTISGNWLACQCWPNVGKPPPTLATIGDVGPTSDCYLGCSGKNAVGDSQLNIKSFADKLTLEMYITVGREYPNKQTNGLSHPGGRRTYPQFTARRQATASSLATPIVALQSHHL